MAVVDHLVPARRGGVSKARGREWKGMKNSLNGDIVPAENLDLVSSRVVEFRNAV